MITILLYILYYIFIGYFLYNIFRKLNVEGATEGKAFAIVTILLWPICILAFIYGLILGEDK